MEILNLFYVQDKKWNFVKHFALRGNKIIHDEDEKLIASALYEGYQAHPGCDIFLMEQYADGYTFAEIIDGKFCVGVRYEHMQYLDTYAIAELFESYRNNTQSPVAVPECYTFLQLPANTNLPALDVTDCKSDYDYRFARDFVYDVMNYPDEYDEKVKLVAKTAFGYNADPCRITYSFAMVDFPQWLQPKGFKSEKVGTRTWKLSAEIDGKYVTGQASYRPSDFGDPGDVELAGKLVELYINSIIEESYFKYVLARPSYKIQNVLDIIKQYLQEERNNNGCIDKEKMLSKYYAQWRRITEKEIDYVIQLYKTNPDILDEYERKNNAMNCFIKLINP